MVPTSKLILVAILTLLALPARAQGLPETIRFGGFGQGFGQPYGVALLAIAQVKGFIADEFAGTPVRLSFEYFTGTGPAINEAIANGRLDFAQYGGLPNIIGKAGGLPTRLVASYGPTLVFGVARKGVPIHGFRDLKGRKVAVAKGTILHWALLRALRESGLTPRDVTLVDLKTADQLAALAAGSIDAAIGTSTHLSLRDRGITDVFYRSSDVGPQAHGFGTITVTETFEAAYPEATRRVVRALARAADWLGSEENREEVFAIWSKSGVPVAALREEHEGLALRDLYNPRLDTFLLAQYRDGIAFSREERLIRGSVDLDRWIAPAYLDQALSELKLDDRWPRRSEAGVPLAH